MTDNLSSNIVVENSKFIELEKKYTEFYYKHIAAIYNFQYDNDSKDSYIQYPLNISNNFTNNLLEHKQFLFDNDHTYHTHKYDHEDLISINKYNKIDKIIAKHGETVQDKYKKHIDTKFYYLLNSDPDYIKPIPPHETQQKEKVENMPNDNNSFIKNGNFNTLTIIDTLNNYDIRKHSVISNTSPD